MLRILLVEDNQLVAEFEKSLLKDYEVMIAETSKEAIEHAKAQNFDLLLQDVLLPDGSGCKTALEIANLQNKLVVAFITARPELISEKELLALKAHKNVLCCIVWDKAKRVAYKIPEIVSLANAMQACSQDSESHNHKPLSNQEIKVLDCVEKRMSSKEIAKALNISHKTVAEYKRRLSDKVRTACATILCHPFLLELLELETIVENAPY